MYLLRCFSEKVLLVLGRFVFCTAVDVSHRLLSFVFYSEFTEKKIFFFCVLYYTQLHTNTIILSKENGMKQTKNISAYTYTLVPLDRDNQQRHKISTTATKLNF